MFCANPDQDQIPIYQDEFCFTMNDGTNADILNCGRGLIINKYDKITQLIYECEKVPINKSEGVLITIKYDSWLWVNKNGIKYIDYSPQTLGFAG